MMIMSGCRPTYYPDLSFATFVLTFLLSRYRNGDIDGGDYDIVGGSDVHHLSLEIPLNKLLTNHRTQIYLRISGLLGNQVTTVPTLAILASVILLLCAYIFHIILSAVGL